METVPGAQVAGNDWKVRREVNRLRPPRFQGKRGGFLFRARGRGALNMCGRYTIWLNGEEDAEELRELMNELQRKAPDAAAAIKLGEIAPGDLAPVIAPNRLRVPAAFAMRWGYRLPGGKLVFNARSETALEKPLFRDGMLNRRCLAPAGSYFEWETRGREKIRYSIRPAGQPIAYLAGVYRIEDGAPAFALLTREPAENIAFIHDRMPVILPDFARSAWLDARNDARDVLKAALTDVNFAIA